MSSTMFWGAVALAAVSAICNGSFSALAKCSRVRNAKVPGYIFNFWLCLGICLASVPTTVGTDLRCVSMQGVLSGLLFVLSTAASMHSIQLIGLHQAVAIGCGTAALVSFAFGAVVESGSISQLPLALMGIACLLAGMVCVAGAGILQQAIAAREKQEVTQQQQQQQLLQSEAGLVGYAERYLAGSAATNAAWLQQPLLPDGQPASSTEADQYTDSSSDNRLKASSFHHTAVGLLLAVTTGLLGGLILAPMDYVGRECRGLPYQAGLAVGVLLSAPVITYCIHWCHVGKVTLLLPTQPIAAALPGILAGTVWAAGICSNMLATAQIGLAIAYPIMQSGMFVAGLWGILLYGELYSLRPHLLYWTGGAVLACGTVLVARSGPAA